jgi:hypothetical protein
MPIGEGYLVEKSMGDIDSTDRNFRRYENRIDTYGETDCSDGWKDHGRKFANGNGSGAQVF